jgi:acetyl-CoA carboxylase carboxyl transferase subunit alpha
MRKKIIEEKIEELKVLAEQEKINISEDLRKLENKLLDGHSPKSDPWQKVECARHPERPTTMDYVSRIFERYIEFHGDRCFGDDPAIIGGIGKIGNRIFTFIGHQKGRSLKENMTRNYGMAHPEGYRKALRLAKDAERFGRPIVTFIDTAGAYPGLEAEERGIGQAIAENLKVFSTLKTPIICFVIGEGGSGGALGLGVGDAVFMLENSTYAVISPEGCASILLRDASKAREASRLLKLTAEDLLSFGIIDGIIPEPFKGAHTNPDTVAMSVKDMMIKACAELSTLRRDELIKRRYERLRNVGVLYEPHAKKMSFFARLFSREVKRTELLPVFGLK